MRSLFFPSILGLLFSGGSAFGNDCNIAESPAIISQSIHELHQVWTIDDSRVYWSQFVTDDPEFLAFRNEIAKLVPDLDQFSILQREHQDFIQSGNPKYLSEAAATKLVLTKQAGHIRHINCLETLLLTLQLKRQPMIQQPSEFGAFILKNTDAANAKLKIYYSTFDRPGGKIDSTVLGMVEHDVAEGWILWQHLHNHNFLFQNPIGVMGGTCPSRSDLQLYLDLVKSYGLQSAAVTNGFSTDDLTPIDFIKLSAQ